jgi:hypothetical protein
MNPTDLLLRLFSRHLRSPNQAIERFQRLVAEVAMPFDPVAELRETVYPPQSGLPHGLTSFIYYFVPGSNQGSELPLPASVAAPAFLKSADGIALNLGCPLRLLRALEALQLITQEERTPLFAALRDPRNHLSAVEEALWITGWKVDTIRRGSPLPGASGDVDWRLQAGGVAVHLEAKFRRSDWARVIHPDSFVKLGDGFLSKALHKFPVREAGNELHVVGITVFDAGTDRLLSAVDAELQVAPRIHGVVVRGLLQMTHILARDAKTADRIRELVAVPDGSSLPGNYPVIFPIEPRDERNRLAPPLPEPAALKCVHHWIGPVGGKEIRLEESNLYRLSIPKREPNGEPHFNILPKYLMEQNDDATEGFGPESAARMRETGLAEERMGLASAHGSNAPDVVRFTRSALADWEFLHGSVFLGAPMQLAAVLAEGLAGLAAGRMARRALEFIGGDGVVWYQRGLCWAIRFDDQTRTIVVHGIAQVRLNPFRKIWRYFDQSKAVDLIRTSELYLCRLDRLKDAYEARPTEAMLRARSQALRRASGESCPDDSHWYDNIRRALYVSCFQKRETESAEMWQEYCPNRGGLAIQVTERSLQHEVARLRAEYPELFFRDIDYVDHATHNPVSHGVPEQAFLKRQNFSHEREIRLASFVPEIFCGTQEDIERCLGTLPDSKRIPFDLDAAVEAVVLNPGCSAEDRAVLLQLIEQLHPTLLPTRRESTTQST